MTAVAGADGVVDWASDAEVPRVRPKEKETMTGEEAVKGSENGLYKCALEMSLPSSALHRECHLRILHRE